VTLEALIRRAYRLAGHLKLDDEPSNVEFDNALEAVQQAVYEVLVQYNRLTPVIVTSDYEAGENEHIFNGVDVNATITLPETVEDAATGEDRPPRNGAMVEIAGATHQAYVYVAHFGAWKRLQGLALSDDNPLGPAHDNDLAALLAVRLATEIPSKLPATTLPMAQAGKTSIRQRFRQSKTVTTDPLLLSPRQRA